MRDMKLLFVIIGFLSLSSGMLTDDNKHVIYILLDRNSPGVYYHENLDIDDSSFVKVIPRTWQVRRLWDTIQGYREGISFSLRMESYKNGGRIERKPVSFLDSIHYYNEDWVRDSFSINHGAHSVYLLDEGTIRGSDSIVVYSVYSSVYEEYICE